VVATVQTAATQVAPTAQAAATQVAPTVQAAQTQVAPAVQAGQATMSAAQTQVAPTAAAFATQIAGTVGPPIATSVAASPVQIASVTVSQEDTKVALRNGGASAVNVSDWILSIGAFPLVLPTSQHLRVDPNETVTLHFSRGTDSDSDVYLGQAPAPLVSSMQSGTRLILFSRLGEIASVYRLP
jgi:hypothetical protein